MSLALLTGCAGPGYYAQAIRGHFQIMNNREDIHDILDNSQTDAELRKELELAIEIREFASSELALPGGDSYTEFVRTGRDAVTWNVIAAPEFSLQPKRWCFLVAGCVPYRGYFSEPAAEAFARKMRERSYDVIVSPAIAYSTLGWFDDPLLDTMLQYDDEQIAGYIFHELAHQELYVKNDSTFNESYASFVEELGVTRWMKQNGRDAALAQWQADALATADFDRLLRQTRQALQNEFDSGHSEEVMRQNKKTIYAGMKVQYRRLVQEKWNGTDFFRLWFSRDVNNARLALADSYQGGLCAFKNLYEQAGRDIVRFQRMAAEKASLKDNQRTAWLTQSCETILSGR